VKEPILLI